MVDITNQPGGTKTSQQSSPAKYHCAVCSVVCSAALKNTKYKQNHCLNEREQKQRLLTEGQKRKKTITSLIQTKTDVQNRPNVTD